MEDPKDCERLKRLQKLKCILHEIEKKLVSLTKTFDWNYCQLIEEDNSDMVTCSINSQHRMPRSKVKLHEETCDLRSQGYDKSDEVFVEYSGSGSCVSLTSQLINSITKNISSVIENKASRSVPQTSANFDQNFNREEKLAIYDYVIANTKKQKTFPDLRNQVVEKKEEKKELTFWGIAAAERNAKRRRASYRNKVHTNCKTHTQILREVIDVQMEMLKEENMNVHSNEESKKHKTGCEKSALESYHLEKKKKFLKSSDCRIEEDDRKRKHNKNHRYKNHSYGRSPSDSRGGSSSRSRSCDKYRERKAGVERSHFHKLNG